MTWWQVAVSYAPDLGVGALQTIRITAVGTLLGVALGLGIAAARLSHSRVLAAVATAYVEVIRGTPQILQLFVVFFGLTQYGVNLPPGLAAGIWLLLYGAGYVSEVFRAGLLSVPHGQREAAEALGLRGSVAMRRVILPQALAVVLPAFTSFLVLQLKASSLVYIIGFPDLMYHARVAVATVVHPMVLYSMAAIGYIILNYPLTRLGAALERRVALYR